MAKSRQHAQITQRVAKFLCYDPDERSTGIGEPTPKNQVQGYDKPNIQAAIDELNIKASVNVGDVFTSISTNNPNPETWELAPQIEDIVVTGDGEDSFWITVDGHDIEVDEGDTATQIGVKVQAVLDDSDDYAIVTESSGVVTITFRNGSPLDIPNISVTPTSPIYGVTHVVAEVNAGGTGSPSNEVQTVTFTGTVAISNTIDIIDDSTSPETVVATITIVAADTQDTVATKIFNALSSISPPYYTTVLGSASSPSTDSNVVQIHYGEIDDTTSPNTINGSLERRSLQFGQAGGIIVKGEYVQKAVSETDIISKRANQIDTVTVDILGSPSEAIFAYNLVFSEIGIVVPIDAGTTADQAADQAAIEIGALDGLTTTYVSGNSFTLEYEDGFFEYLTNYNEGFDTNGSTGIALTGDADPSGDIIIRYVTSQAIDRAGELGYGKWEYFGEGEVIGGCPISSIVAAGVGVVNNTILSEPFTITATDSPPTNVFNIEKDLFDISKIMFSTKSSNGVYITEVTLAHDGTDISYTHNVIVNTDDNDSAFTDPIDIDILISGENLEFTITNNSNTTVDVAVKISQYDKISRSLNDNSVYYWKRIG